MQRRPPDALKRDTGDVRTLGVILVILGSLPLIGVAASSSIRLSFLSRLMAIVDTLILVGPGVWYVIAPTLMRRGNLQAVIISRRVLLAQLAIIAGILGFGFGGLMLTGRRSQETILLLPAMLAVFFVPALLALLLALRRVQKTLRLLDPGGYAFETLPVAKVVEETQPIDSLREK